MLLILIFYSFTKNKRFLCLFSPNFGLITRRETQLPLTRSEACGINSMDNQREKVISETGKETKSSLDPVSTETKQADEEGGLRDGSCLK